MVLLVLTFLLIVVFFYDEKIFMYALMVFFVLFDMLDGFYDDEKIFAAMRYIVPFCCIFYFVIKTSAFKKSDFIFLLVSLYLIVLLVYLPGNFIISAKTVLAIFITLLMIPVGRHLGRHFNFLEEFEGFNRFLLIALPVYIIIANIFHFGESYTDAFTTGFLVTSRMYVVPIVVFLAIHYLITNKDRSWIAKAIDVTFILISICILIVNTRRTALGMLIAALLIYTVLNRHLVFKMIMLTLFLISALVFSYPLYEERLTAQLEKRERIKDIDTYEEEGRFLEAFYILDHHSRREDISEVLFGIKLFDTTDFGMRYFGRERPIHSDFNMIFYSTGITGLLLFGIFFLHYFFLRNGKIVKQSKKIYYPILIMFLIVLVPGRFIGTLTYAPFLMLILSATKAWNPQVVIYEQEEELEVQALH